MMSIALEIPDDPSQLPGWLERHVVGLDLAALIAELEAVHGTKARSEGPGGLVAVLGDRRDEVMERGLAALPREAIRNLLRHPRLLLDLQEQAILFGGQHWQRLVESSDELGTIAGRGRGRLDEMTRTDSVGSEGEPRAIVAIQPVAWFRRPWVVSLATAASVLAAVLLYEGTRPRASITTIGWGWDKPGALSQAVPASDYLNGLAAAAADWFKKRPDDAASVARRIGEFRQGCSTLILAEHRPLLAEDRAWLVGKCRDWATKLDAHLRAVEAGENPAKVLVEADETVRKLIAAIRTRAKMV